MALSPNKGIASKKYNLNCIYKRIKAFYKEKLNITAEENFKDFDSKKAVENNSDSEFLKLLELLAGISAQCDKREFYLDIMQNMDEPYSSEILNILTEKITNYIEKENEINNCINYLDNISHSLNSEDNDLTEINLILNEKIENLELGNTILNEKLNKLIENNKQINIEKDSIEKKYKEYEEKYNLLIDSMNYENNKKAIKKKK